MNMKPGPLMPPFEGRVMEDVLAARSSDPDAFDAWRIKDEDITRVVNEMILPVAREWVCSADEVLGRIPRDRLKLLKVRIYYACLTYDRHLKRESSLPIPAESQREYVDRLVVIDDIRPSPSAFLERLFPIVSYSDEGRSIAPFWGSCMNSQPTAGRMIPVALLRGLIKAMQQEDGKRPLYVNLRPQHLIYGETGIIPDVEKVNHSAGIGSTENPRRGIDRSVWAGRANQCAGF